MTGKEAIHLVRTAPLDQVRRWRESPASSATLRRVCGWRLDEAHDGWPQLLGALALVDVPPLPNGIERAEAVWSSEYCTFEELAARAQITIGTARALKRTVFRDREWLSRPAGKNLKAYRLAT